MQITAFKAILARIINIQGCEDYENTFARMESDCTLTCSECKDNNNRVSHPEIISRAPANCQVLAAEKNA